MKILITGGTGFIGTRFALHARASGHEIVVTGLANTDVERRRLDELSALGIAVQIGSLQDAKFVCGLLAGCDCVIHLAAAQHEANVPDAYFRGVNVEGTRTLLDACVAAGVKRFVYGSTIGVYGCAGSTQLHEESVTRPENIYGITKLEAECVVRSYAPQLATTIIRISETYGPDDQRLLKLFKAARNGWLVLIGDGANRRQPIHVEDLVRGLLLAAQHPGAVGETFVLAGGRAFTTREMLRDIGAALDRKVRILRIPMWPMTMLAVATEWMLKPLRIQPPLHRRRLDFYRKSFWFSIDKARNLLGFEPLITFAAGARDTAHAYASQGALDRRSNEPVEFTASSAQVRTQAVPNPTAAGRVSLKGIIGNITQAESLKSSEFDADTSDRMFTSDSAHVTSPDRTTRDQVDRWAPWLRLAGAFALIAGGTFLLARAAAFSSVIALVATHLSPDGVLSASGRARLSGLLVGTGLFAAASGALLWALSYPRWRRALDAAIRWDTLRTRGLAVPNPYSVMVSSACLALLVIALWTLRSRLGEPALLLFAKEGPLEQATFVLEFVAAGLCAGAALHWRPREDRYSLLVRSLYGLCAFALFIVAMEEINWGQTLIGFETPAAWAAINYQQETSLHNLLDRDTLTDMWKFVAPAFGITVLGMIAWSARAPRSVIGAIAPHASLIPLATAIACGGTRLHPEVIELLLGLFFAFYAWRLYVAARSSANMHADGTTHPWMVIRAIVAVGLIVVLLGQADWPQATQKIANISPWAATGVLALMMLGLIVSTWKWSFALRMHDLRYPFPHLFRALTAGFFFNNFLPTAIGGDAYRIYRTLPSTKYRSRALSAVAVERAMGFLMLLALGALGALLLIRQFDAALVYCWLLLGATLVGTTGFLALERGWLRPIVARGRMARLVDAIGHNLSLLHRRRGEWLSLAAASIVFQLISVGTVFILFDLVGARVSLAQCALIAAVVGASAALPISINGLGVMEGTFVAMSALVGIDYEHALVVAFARRFIALLLGALGGLLYLTETRTETETGKSAPRALFQALREVAAMLVRTRTPISTEALSDPDVPLARVRRPGDVRTLSTELLEYTHDAIIIWEMDGDGIVYWNRAAEQLYGYRRNDALGRVTHELLKTQLAGGVGHLQLVLARFGVWVGELRHTARDGREIIVDARLALLAQHDDKWLVLEVNRDVTDAVNAEAARAAAERQLAELGCLHRG